MALRIRFHVENAGEKAAGLHPYSETVDVIVHSGDAGGDAEGEDSFAAYMQRCLTDWFDGSSVQYVYYDKKFLHELDRVFRPEDVVEYERERVAETEPTCRHECKADGDCCDAIDEGWFCTRSKGHEGPHSACSSTFGSHDFHVW